MPCLNDEVIGAKTARTDVMSRVGCVMCVIPKPLASMLVPDISVREYSLVEEV